MTRCALYRFFDGQDVLLYIGISLNPHHRWRHHRLKQPWWHEVSKITIQTFDTREAAAAAEFAAIRNERPRHNRALNRAAFLDELIAGKADHTPLGRQEARAAGRILIRRLTDERRHRGLSQADVGAAAGMKQPVVARLETGGRDMKFSTLLEYASAIGMVLKLVETKLIKHPAGRPRSRRRKANAG